MEGLLEQIVSTSRQRSVARLSPAWLTAVGLFVLGPGVGLLWADPITCLFMSLGLLAAIASMASP